MEVEDKLEELKMADGTMVQMEGRVQFLLKCGGCRGKIFVRFFPNMNKQMILGILLLSKENSHSDWTRVAMVMKKGQDWISLPLAKSQQQSPVHLASEVNARQLDKMLKKEEVE